MIKIHICTIAEVHQNGEIYNTIIREQDDRKALERVNAYFQSEKDEEHEVSGAIFSTLKEANGFDRYDDCNDRHYSILCDCMELDGHGLAIRESLSDHGPGNPRESVFAKTFLSELNHQPFSGERFARALCQEHPTTQQLFFRLVKDCILARASESAYSSDERCASSVRFCRDLENLVRKYHFPMR